MTLVEKLKAEVAKLKTEVKTLKRSLTILKKKHKQADNTLMNAVLSSQCK